MNKTTPTLDRAAFTADYIRIVGSAQATEKYATEALADRFFRLTERLLAANAVMNLTAITDPREMILKHYFDSLCLVPYLQKVGASLADVGCGAGFPTLPLAIARPDLAITAIDSTDKRIVFVRETAAALGLTNVTAVTARAEDAGAGELRGTFDYVTARAVARLNMLCEFCIPLLRVGGEFLPMKGKSGEEELTEAENAIAVLRAKTVEYVEYAIRDPAFDEDRQERFIARIRKTDETEKIYPRSFAQIKKKPL